MPRGYQPTVELLTKEYGGVNNARQFSQLPREQSPQMKNAVMKKIGSISKRAGTIPVTSAALAGPIKYLTTYKASASAADVPKIFAASGTTLYKFVTNTLVAMSMTNALASADIYTTGFTDSLLISVLAIGDGTALKRCDGSTVSNVIPAPDYPSPAAANVLAGINAKGHRFIWEYSGHIFSSPGTNEVFYSDRYMFDYFPEVNYGFLVKNNDYVNGAGVAFDNVCLIPMRHSWNIWSGVNFDNFRFDTFLNTTDGVIAPRSITKLTYPDGTQTIAFLSDDGVHEVYTAVYNDTSRQYATRSLMKDLIDFNNLNLTESEKGAAVGYFDNQRSLYMLSFKKSGVNYTYAYDLRNKEWYPDWLTFNAQAYVSLDSEMYFAGSTGHLHKFDDELYSDWNDSAKTTGTPVEFERYSPLLSLEFSGYDSYWDSYLLEARQFLVPASVSLQIVFGNTTATTQDNSPWKLNVAVYGSSRYGQARYANLQYTDIVNSPNRLIFRGKKAKYVQMRWYNFQDQPVEVYKDKWIGRTSGQ